MLVVTAPVPILTRLAVWFSRSVVSDSATPWTVAHQAPLSLRFSRQEYCSGLPCPSPGDVLFLLNVWRRKWQPTPIFLPGESHGQRSPAGYGPWGRLQCPSRRGQGGRHGALVDHLGGHAAGTAPRPGLTQSRPVTASYTAFLILRRQQAGPHLLGQFSDGISCVPAWGSGQAGRGRWTDCPWSVYSHLIFSHSSHSTDPVVF